MRKRNSGAAGLAMAAALLAAAGCVPRLAYEKIRVAIPGPPAFKLAEAAEVILVPFRPEPEGGELAFAGDLDSFLSAAVASGYSGPVVRRTISWPEGGKIDDPSVWKSAGVGGPGSVIVTGTATLAQEARKALVGPEKSKFETPFAPETPWAERRNFKLSLTVLAVRAETGEIVFREKFEDQIATENLKTPAEFALWDLLDRIRPKLRLKLFGAPRSEERFLLLK